MLNNTLKSELINSIKNIPEIERAFIFGSYAMGTENENSDLDLVVILKKRGIPESYMDRVNNQLFISKKIKELCKKIPIDLLVYTYDEWSLLENNSNDFIKNIREQGIIIK